jgi:hypothetical protein
MALFNDCFQNMKDENPELIAEFTKIHKKFKKDPDKNRAKFNEVGDKFLALVNRYESILCGRSESSIRYAQFTNPLSEKFRDLIKEEFSEFEEIGML